jgi:Mn-containing catalase
LSSVFKGESPFDDRGELEIIEGHPEGANIPLMPDAPQEFASGLDTDLRKLAQQVVGVSTK